MEDPASFRSLGAIPSGPVALLGFSASTCLHTASWVILTVSTVGVTLPISDCGGFDGIGSLAACLSPMVAKY